MIGIPLIVLGVVIALSSLLAVAGQRAGHGRGPTAAAVEAAGAGGRRHRRDRAWWRSVLAAFGGQSS